MDTMPEREQLDSPWPTTVVSTELLAAEIPHPQTSFEIWGNSARCLDDAEPIDRHILRGLD